MIRCEHSSLISRLNLLLKSKLLFGVGVGEFVRFGITFVVGDNDETVTKLLYQSLFIYVLAKEDNGKDC